MSTFCDQLRTEDYEGSDSHITKRLESLIQKRENLYM